MNTRPILFSAPMVRALLNGSKTQTRRVVKPWVVSDLSHKPVPADLEYLPDFTCYRSTCPYGQPGDRLWVRETFAEGIHQMADVNHWAYAADHFGVQQRLGDRWKPSIHMPRAASRITLEITSVRMERLQDISEADAIAEGIESEPGTAHWKNYDPSPGGWRYWESPIQSYRTLWNSINGPDAWDENPWVWVVAFKRVEGGA